MTLVAADICAPSLRFALLQLLLLLAVLCAASATADNAAAAAECSDAPACTPAHCDRNPASKCNIKAIGAYGCMRVFVYV